MGVEGRMASMQILTLCLVGGVTSQLGSPPQSTTPVPILRYIDSQNADGSYTYGFEGADGTYEIETRLADGQVRGKYGYYDPTGQLREASYGASSEGGFQPNIQGLVLPPSRLGADTSQNEVEQQQAPALAPAPASAPARRFRNFAPRKAAGER